MNASTFRLHVLMVIAAFAVFIALLFGLRQLDASVYPNAYNTFKDAVPLLVAIPAAWLAFCVQRRQAYLKDVRDLWAKLVLAVQDAIQYTHLTEPPQAEYAKTLKSLSIIAEELRAVFQNIGETRGNTGIFPFEGLKDIHRVVSTLGYGAGAGSTQAAETRHHIIKCWKSLRANFLSELERGEPARPDSPFLN